MSYFTRQIKTLSMHFLRSRELHELIPDGISRIRGNSASGCQECTRVAEAHQQSPACQTEVNASMASDQISKWWMCRTAQRLTAAQNPPVSSLQGWYSFMSSNHNLSFMLHTAILGLLFIGWKTFALTEVLSGSNRVL